MENLSHQLSVRFFSLPYLPAGRAREKATLWRLVNARCTQLSDAITAVRTPFLVTMLWALIWGWQLYNGEYGWSENALRPENEARMFVLDTQVAGKYCQQFIDSSNTVLDTSEQIPDVLNDTAKTDDRVKVCRDIATERLKLAEDAAWGADVVSFPGGLGKLSVTDLGTIGQASLLLLLFWTYFYVKRENHALRSFVDRDRPKHQLLPGSPGRFKLQSQTEYLSSEHVSYAYQVIAQRFMLISSRHSKFHSLIVGFWCVFPALIAIWNFYTDVRDYNLSGYPFRSQALLERFHAMTIVEGILLLLVCVPTYLIFFFVYDSHVILNAWYLADRDVWSGDWDERTDYPAPAVAVDLRQQIATPWQMDVPDSPGSARTEFQGLDSVLTAGASSS